MAVYYPKLLFYILIFILVFIKEVHLRNSSSKEVGIEYFDSAMSRNKSCASPWTYHDSRICKCGEAPKHYDVLKCENNTNSTLLNFNCLTFDEATWVYEIGKCTYSTVGAQKSTMITLPRFTIELNEFMCGQELNRNGTLCGECKKGIHCREFRIQHFIQWGEYTTPFGGENSPLHLVGRIQHFIRWGEFSTSCSGWNSVLHSVDGI